MISLINRPMSYEIIFSDHDQHEGTRKSRNRYTARTDFRPRHSSSWSQPPRTARTAEWWMVLPVLWHKIRKCWSKYIVNEVNKTEKTLLPALPSVQVISDPSASLLPLGGIYSLRNPSACKTDKESRIPIDSTTSKLFYCGRAKGIKVAERNRHVNILWISA